MPPTRSTGRCTRRCERHRVCRPDEGLEVGAMDEHHERDAADAATGAPAAPDDALSAGSPAARDDVLAPGPPAAPDGAPSAGPPAAPPALPPPPDAPPAPALTQAPGGVYPAVASLPGDPATGPTAPSPKRRRRALGVVTGATAVVVAIFLKFGLPLLVGTAVSGVLGNVFGGSYSKLPADQQRALQQ